MSGDRLRIGYIPLVDAAAVVVAVDKDFSSDEGLDVELVREVSWSNVRDKLNIGLFDAAHLLSPLAVASSLGIGHVRVPLIAPFNLGYNGNAITVTPDLMAALQAATADGDLSDPMVSARALAGVVANRKTQGLEPLTFGMTFPFSNHNYQLRFWMAAGGVDPDEDVRLVVLPPPYMVESLASGHVDGFCVGAPWNSVAVDHGLGHILHFGCDILARMSEKVLAVRGPWAQEHPDRLRRLLRALRRAADFIEQPENHGEVAALLGASDRIAVAEDIVRSTLSGDLKIGADGARRAATHYLKIGDARDTRPAAPQAAWIYAQMVRWGQAPLSPELLMAARSVYRPDIYDAAIGECAAGSSDTPGDGVGAFTGPHFNPVDISQYLSAWMQIPRTRPRLVTD